MVDVMSTRSPEGDPGMGSVPPRGERRGGVDATGGHDAVSLTRIVLRPIASRIPLGLLAFGVATVLLSLEQLGVLTESRRAEIDLVILVLVFPPEILCAVLAFLARETMAAAGIACMGFVWPATVVAGPVNGGAAQDPAWAACPPASPGCCCSSRSPASSPSRCSAR